MNQVNIIGNVTKDAKMYNAGKQPACYFQVAVSEKWKDHEGNPQEKVNFIPCAVYGKHAERIASMALKGTLVAISGGKLQITNKKDESGKYSTNVNVVISGGHDFRAIKWGSGEKSESMGSIAAVDEESPF